MLDHMAGQVMRGDSMIECFTLTGALAASTTTIGIGTLVANVWNRSLGVLAVAAASAQEISGGRFWLGIGAGASPRSPFGAEHAAAGIALAPDMAARHQRVAISSTSPKDMWSDGAVDGVTGFPVPVDSDPGHRRVQQRRPGPHWPRSRPTASTCAPTIRDSTRSSRRRREARPPERGRRCS